MRIAIAGMGRLAAQLTYALSRSHHDIVAVIQNGRVVRGVQRIIHRAAAWPFAGELSMLYWARRLNVPVIWLDQHSDAELAPLRALQPDLLLVGGFSVILKPPILQLPRLGCVNAHSSLLPRHRGPNPFSAVILQEEAESGVTFHVVDEGIDTGPILGQVPFEVKADDTMFGVYRRACKVAGDNVCEVMDRIEEKGLVAWPQDESRATYDPKLKVEDSWIDWRWPADQIDRFVRALSPAPMPRFRQGGRTVEVYRVRAYPQSTGKEPGTIVALKPRVRIAAGRGAVELIGAHTRSPFPFLWPSPWARARVGEVLPVPEQEG